MDSITKVCRKCGIEKSTSEYAKEPKAKSGITATCKACLYKQDKEYAQAHPEKGRERIRKHNQKFPEKRAKRRRDYISKNPEKQAIYNQNRLARKNGNGGFLTSKQWKDLCDFYGNKCLCCGKVGKLSIDHVKPLALGGSNDISNIQPLCQSCNSKKNMKHIDYRK